MGFWKSSRPSMVGGRETDEAMLPAAGLTEADAIITPNEANERHGIGILVERFFGAFGNTLSIRSQNSFGGQQSFGTRRLLVSHAGLARWESYQHLLRLVNGSTVSRILCVPFFADDLITAICLKELFDAPLCVYVMDDNNIGAHGIPDRLFAEALGKARLRLGISPEICEAYGAKFGSRFHVLPPLVDRRLVSSHPILPEAAALERRPGALIGNVWSQKWLERLRGAVRGSGVKLVWYGNTQASWLNYGAEELRADGIESAGFLPEEELIDRLRWHPFAVIPSGSLDENDDRPELARLSLPSRIPYLTAVANLPLLVLGSPETAAGHFVTRFKIGEISPYDARSFAQAVARLTTPEEQFEFRQNASRIASAFSLENPGQWIWDSLALGQPADQRFEALFQSGAP